MSSLLEQARRSDSEPLMVTAGMANCAGSEWYWSGDELVFICKHNYLQESNGKTRTLTFLVARCPLGPKDQRPAHDASRLDQV
jgi:hypothetical protein